MVRGNGNNNILQAIINVFFLRIKSWKTELNYTWFGLKGKGSFLTFKLRSLPLVWYTTWWLDLSCRGCKISWMLRSYPVWPDWAIYWTLGNFLKPLATNNLSKSPTFLAIFVKVLKSIIFLVKSFLGNFYRHLAIFSGHTVHFLGNWSRPGQMSNVCTQIKKGAKTVFITFWQVSEIGVNVLSSDK